MPRIPAGVSVSAVLTAALFLAAGCVPSGEQGGRPGGQAPATPAADARSGAARDRAEEVVRVPRDSAAPPAIAADAAAQVVLRTADRQVYDQVLARHRGKPVLVDFWATWCVPCTEQFPHTVKLHGKYAAKGLAVVAVSLDEPGDEAQVRAFLEKQGATFDNLLSQWGSDEPSFEHFDIRGGTIPHYKLYDRDGRLVETFAIDPAAARQFSLADIERSVVRLLQASS